MTDFKNNILNKLHFEITSGDINLPNNNGIFLIYAILNSDFPDILEEAIENGININQDLGKGWTPLHESIDDLIDGMIQNNREFPYPESLEFVKILLRNGANIDAKDINGMAPLDSLNVYSGNLETFNHLIKILREVIPDIEDKVLFTKTTL